VKSNLLVSIDPGYRYCGIAVFSDGRLTHAEHVDAKVWDTEAQQFASTASAVWEFLETTVGKAAMETAELAIEYPQQYLHSPAPRESVQRLVGTVGAVLAQVQGKTGGLSVKVSTYKPREWKGQVPKDIMGKRIVARLSAQEVPIIPALPKSKLHNVVDAIGVGLYHLRRLRRKRVAQPSKEAS